MKTITLPLLSILLGISSAFAQTKPENRKPIEIPQMYGVVSTIDQNDSPVDFQEVQLFTDDTGGFPKLRYSVKNKTSKPIVYLSVEFLQRSSVKSWGGHSDGWIENSGEEVGTKVLVDSGGSFANLAEVDGVPVLGEQQALELFDNESQKPRILTFWVGFIRKVKFADGTEFASKIDGRSLTDLLLHD